MRYTVRPISDRTRFTGRHTDSPFTVNWSAALELLERELTALKAREVIMEVDVDEAAIRMDGMLRGDARAKSPAVRLVFESKVGTPAYATDRYTRGRSYVYRGGVRVETMRQSWQHNVYAIAKGLEALRLVDRYGVTQRGEQYQGYKQLPSGNGVTATHMTREEAYRVLRSTAGIAGADGLSSKLLVRTAKANSHPDRRGGDRTLWDQVEQAERVLDR